MDVGHVRRWVSSRHWAAWVVSGVGLALAGLSLWYLIVIRALYLGSALDASLFTLGLRVLEVVLLAGFSLVLVYGGYWLVSSPFDGDRLWWTGLWTLLGLGGVVALVSLVVTFRVIQGRPIFEPSLIQEMLFAAGGGAVAGLLIGISTVRETVEGEEAKRQRDTLVFMNKLLRHNVLNGMQIIEGNVTLLRDHVDEEGRQYLETTEQRADSIVELIDNVRALTRSVSGDTPLKAIRLRPTLDKEVANAADSYPDADFTTDTIPDVAVHADELLDTVFENLLTNAVEHNDATTPQVDVTVVEYPERVAVRIADNGPGIPEDERQRLLEPGERGPESVGQGLGLYLVTTLVDRYGGNVTIEANEPRGTVIEVSLPYASQTAAA